MKSYISTATLGKMEYAKGWKFTNTTIEVTKPEEKKKTAAGIEEQERLKQ